MSFFNRLYPISMLMILMALFQWTGNETLRYQTDLIAQGEWWRLLSGHFVHANWIHYLLNMSGLLLCLYLTMVEWSGWRWLCCSVLLAVWISLMFLWWLPGMGWYVGFSGVLFGLFAMASIAVFQQQPWMSAIILMVIVGRVMMEQFSDLTLDSGELIGVPVMVDAHLHGLIGGLIMATMERIIRWRTNLSTTI